MGRREHHRDYSGWQCRRDQRTGRVGIAPTHRTLVRATAPASAVTVRASPSIMSAPRGNSGRGPSSEPAQRRSGLSPERRGRSAVRFRPLRPKQESSCSISNFIGVNFAFHVATAFWAAAKTSRADVVPATCFVPSTPSAVHPVFTASNIGRAGPVRPFGMPNCSHLSTKALPLAAALPWRAPRHSLQSRPWLLCNRARAPR